MEHLKVYDIDKNYIGIASRTEIHKKGLWHETFHCWFACQEGEKTYIYFQLRSRKKADFPYLLDVTSAGHILADETIQDGIREVEEELGISLTIDDIEKLAEIPYCVIKDKGEFIDREFANVYLYRQPIQFLDFTLQKEEVAGIFRAEWTEFVQLFTSLKEKIEMDGFEILDKGIVQWKKEKIGMDAFVPHPEKYYHCIIKEIGERL
ncbi:isopentenyldiphosphate isomerase [Cytobacillus horneckiae]|uniref:NUDIX hydrolase n=2 Tax=Cytobacillus horneckiae TaxID=549687 RepID=UPI0019D222E8|nr:NUDIX domain-containing protein [Cytobacillus horneckiae]MBN6887387.1 NUDIX domain-containing protein [Cytobacillus horneckiae]